MISPTCISVLVTALTVANCKLGHAQAFHDFDGSRIHGLSKYLLGTYLDNNLVCEVECNGEKYKALGGTDYGSEEDFSCWGKSYTKCYIPRAHANVTSTYKCDGAFLYKPITTSEGSHIKALHCEGAVLLMTEVQGEIIPGSGIECPGSVCAFGTFCAVDSEIVFIDKEGFNETGIRCQGIMVDGSAVKLQSPNSLRALAPGSRRLQATPDDPSALDPVAPPRRSDLPSPATPSVTQVLESNLLAASRSSLPISEHSTAAPQASKPSANLVTGSPKIPSKDAPCEWRCNENSINPFFRWWPCWGKTQVTCSFETEKVSQTVEYECDGFAVPGLRRCSGLLTIHTSAATPHVAIEDIHVLGGRSHISMFREHGYAGSMFVSSGLSTVHERLTPKASQQDSQTHMLELGQHR